MTGEVRDAGYADLIDALVEGEGYYLECANGHGSLPPRHVCPHCGSRELAEQPLPESGEIETFTVIHAPTPDFSDDAPFVTAVVDFGPVGLTGQVRGVDPDSVEIGMTVTPAVVETETTGDRLIGFSPQ